jgi:ribonuclease E
MTVVDVNTGKFTGSGGNLEETVTKNNLEAAEEVVRQLRLRDIGGIIVIDFIDMVLESNRDLVLRRLVECLGRDRTRHQVAEVTSLGLVQMTRKRIGTGLLEAFGEECEHCKGRGVIVHEQPIEPNGRGSGADEGRSRRGRGGRSRARGAADSAPEPVKPSPMALAGTKPHPATDAEPDLDTDLETEAVAEVESQSDVEAPETESAQPTVEVTWAVAVPAETAPDEATTETESPADTGSPAESPVESPVESPAESPAEEAADQPAEAVPVPMVVTSTRRRRAGRPAGPPAAVADAAEAGTDVPEADAQPSAGDDEEHAHSLLHVPVKKKGSRKR